MAYLESAFTAGLCSSSISDLLDMLLGEKRDVLLDLALASTDLTLYGWLLHLFITASTVITGSLSYLRNSFT